MTGVKNLALIVILFVAGCASLETMERLRGAIEAETRLIAEKASLEADAESLRRQINTMRDTGDATAEELRQKSELLERTQTDLTRTTSLLASARTTAAESSRLAQEEKDRGAARASAFTGSLLGSGLRATLGMNPVMPKDGEGPPEAPGLPWKQLLGGAGALIATQLPRLAKKNA